MARIKRNDRASLKDQHLESAMRVSFTDMNVQQLNVQHAGKLIRIWKDEKRRRNTGKGDSQLSVPPPYYFTTS